MNMKITKAFIIVCLYIIIMSPKIQNSVKINNRKVYHAETDRGWTVVIIPDNIIIDN